MYVKMFEKDVRAFSHNYIVAALSTFDLPNVLEIIILSLKSTENDMLKLLNLKNFDCKVAALFKMYLTAKGIILVSLRSIEQF